MNTNVNSASCNAAERHERDNMFCWNMYYQSLCFAITV